MTGKEIVEICKRYETCDQCELMSGVPWKDRGCMELMRDIGEAVPGDYFDILEQEYGGDT